MTSHLLNLRCSACGAAAFRSPNDLLEFLRDRGLLRRHDDPSHALVHELAQSLWDAGTRPHCPECGQDTWKIAENEEDADAEWGDPVPCEECGSLIPAERLELFPDSKLCVRCQKKVESGGPSNQAEYCPYCGDIVELKLVTKSAAAYRRYCRSCRKVL